MARKKVSQSHSDLQRVLIEIRSAGAGIPKFRIVTQTGILPHDVHAAVERLLEAKLIAVYDARREKDPRDGSEHETYHIPVRKRAD